MSGLGCGDMGYFIYFRCLVTYNSALISFTQCSKVIFCVKEKKASHFVSLLIRDSLGLFPSIFSRNFRSPKTYT